jgi:hypothetical protein
MCCRQGKVATGPRGEEWAGKGGRSELEQAARGGGGKKVGQGGGWTGLRERTERKWVWAA